MPARTYRAERFGVARVVEDGAPDRPLFPRLDLRSFGLGFAWGYKLGGPQQLALAILCDIFDDDAALRYVEDFTVGTIAKRPKDLPFEITEHEVRCAVADVAKEAEQCSE